MNNATRVRDLQQSVSTLHGAREFHLVISQISRCVCQHQKWRVDFSPFSLEKYCHWKRLGFWLGELSVSGARPKVFSHRAKTQRCSRSKTPRRFSAPEKPCEKPTVEILLNVKTHGWCEACWTFHVSGDATSIDGTQDWRRHCESDLRNTCGVRSSPVLHAPLRECYSKDRKPGQTSHIVRNWFRPSDVVHGYWHLN